MNKIRVERIVDIFCNNLQISNIRYRSIIKELMVNIISKYEKLGIKEIEDNQEYLIKKDNNMYSVEDFFLNRLLFNVTNFEVKNNGNRAFFDPNSNSIFLNRGKLSNLLDKFSNYNFTDEEKFLAAKKVVMHEFEHALQTQYDKGPNINSVTNYKNLYKKLLEANMNLNLNPLYDGRRIGNKLGKGNKKQSGVMGNENDIYKKYKGTFYLEQNDPNYFMEDNLNEIFNESEALLISGSNQNLEIIFPSGNRTKVRNLESSNQLITNYGFILKMLLGEKNTFEGMYQDRNIIINYFNNNYGKIFEEVFKDHMEKHYPNVKSFDGWSILNMAINETKYSHENGAKEYSEICHLKLNLSFSLCLEKMIKRRLDIGETFENAKQMWEEYTNFVVYNKDVEKNKELPHIKVLFDLKEYIKKYKTIEDNLTNQKRH